MDSQFSDRSSLKSNKFQLQSQVHILPWNDSARNKEKQCVKSLGQLLLFWEESEISGAWQESEGPGPPSSWLGWPGAPESGMVVWMDFLVTCLEEVSEEDETPPPPPFPGTSIADCHPLLPTPVPTGPWEVELGDKEIYPVRPALDAD